MSDPQAAHRHQRWWFWAAALALGAALLAYEFWFKAPRVATAPPFRTERFGLPQNAVTVENVKPAKDLAGAIGDDELVLSVTVAKETRAYPLNMMYAAPQTKALNDTLGGRPVVVTWCEKCMSGAVFDREVNGHCLTFAIFGSLWLDTIVLYDTETWTQWSQWDGAAKLGQYAGRTLSAVPCLITDWKSWREQYPDGTVAVLDAKRAKFDTAAYVKADDFLLVAGDGTSAKAWELGELRQRRVLNDMLAGEPVAAVFWEAGGTARLFGRLVEGTTLTLAWRDGQLQDAESGTVWDAWTGAALTGPRQGQVLPAKASRLCTRVVWKRFSS